MKKLLLATALLVVLTIPALAQTNPCTPFVSSSIGDVCLPITQPAGDGSAGMILNNTTQINGPNAGTPVNTIITGGAAFTSASQGGSARLHGGLPGATGVGGDATVRGGIGGSTSGSGGLASITGGDGTAGNATGGLARAVGGAGQGSGAGGASHATGGAGGGTGPGGQVNINGGAGGSTSGNGGSVIIGGGGVTSGSAGMIIKRSVELVNQGAPAAATVSATLTAANLQTGIITVLQGAAGASAQQLPLATAMDTAFPDAAAGDAFDFSVINISTTAAESASVTTNTGWTLVGDMDIAANNAITTKSAGRFRARKTGTGTWTLYRLS